MLTTVIFDWAGTTVDYGCFAPVEAFAQVFKNYGIEATMDEVRSPMGMLKWAHIRTMLEMPRIKAKFIEIYDREPSDDDADIMYAQFEEALFSILAQNCELKPYVLETIGKLREKGIKIGSTTGYTDAMMEVVTKEAKAQGYEPDCWFSPDSVAGIGRPYPFMVYENMKTLKVETIQQVIKVGDTVSDIKEGKHAGAFTVGILEGSSEMGLTKQEYDALSEEEKNKLNDRIRERYLAAGADAVIADIRGVLSFFE